MTNGLPEGTERGSRMASESATKARSPSPPIFIPSRSPPPDQSGSGTGKSSLPSYDARMPNDLGIITSASEPERPLAMSPRGPLHLHTHNAAGTTRTDSAQRRHALGEQAGGGAGATTTEPACMKREASDTPTVHMASPPPLPADAVAASRTPSHLPLAPHPPVDTFARPSTTARVAHTSSTAAALSRPVDIPAETSRAATADSATHTSASGIMHGRSTASPSVSPTPEPSTAFSELPALVDTPRGRARTELFKAKVKLCCQVHDFTDGTRDVAEKEGKRTTLIELVDYVSTTKGALPEEVYRPLVDMFRANLFRTLHPASGTSPEAALAGDIDEDEPVLEPAWPHLQIVYELLLRFVVSPEVDPRVARKYIDQRFVLGVLDLFDSEDPRERDYLKTVLHRIYGKFMPLRPFIRRAIANVFLFFVFESERHNGIAELLEILGSIINGFALPLKEEHKNFLRRALLPLHIPRCIAQYHQQLVYCMTQFVEKHPPLAVDVIRGLLKYWPLTNSPKEVLFLAELEEVIEQTHPREFSVVLEDLFRRIAKCIQSPHFQVAERTLFLWNNEYLVSLILQYRERVFPLVFAALANNERSHWNTTVMNLTFNVQKLMIEMDVNLFERCARLHERALLGEAHAGSDAETAREAAALHRAAPTEPRSATVTASQPMPIAQSGAGAASRSRDPSGATAAVSADVLDSDPNEEMRDAHTDVSSDLEGDNEATDHAGALESDAQSEPRATEGALLRKARSWGERNVSGWAFSEHAR